MLSQAPIHAYIPVADVARARQFYEKKIGLTPKEAGASGVLYECAGGTRVYVYKSGGAGTNRASTAYWEVADVEAEMKELRAHGVVFEDYDLPGLKTKDGLMVFADGGKNAWFKDVDGNILALIQRR